MDVLWRFAIWFNGYIPNSKGVELVKSTFYAKCEGGNRMKEIFERTLSDEIIVWGMGDVTHDPKLGEISLDRHKGWEIGQRVQVTIELIRSSASTE
jgi:hypothetical protein